MGKKAKEHRAKVAKRNKEIAQKRYSMENALNKMMKQMVEQQEAEKLNVTVDGKEVPFEVVSQPISNGIKGFEFEGNVSFKEKHPEMFETTEFQPEEPVVDTTETETE